MLVVPAVHYKHGEMHTLQVVTDTERTYEYSFETYVPEGQKLIHWPLYKIVWLWHCTHVLLVQDKQYRLQGLQVLVVY